MSAPEGYQPDDLDSLGYAVGVVLVGVAVWAARGLFRAIYRPI